MKKTTSPEQTLRLMAGIILKIAEGEILSEKQKKMLRSIKKFGYLLFDGESLEFFE